MLKFILSAALVTALSSAAFAQSVGEQTGVNSALGIAPKTEDFIKEAATSDMLEIDAAKIAQQKGNAGEKQFAQQMVTDHTKTSSELKGLVPADMKSALQTTLSGDLRPCPGMVFGTGFRYGRDREPRSWPCRGIELRCIPKTVVFRMASEPLARPWVWTSAKCQ